jgi:aubergine-like protein
VLINKKNNLKVFNVSGTSQTPIYNNIPPGTLVDNVIVSKHNYDFFLISQKTNQGLSQATHYQVIFDDFRVNTEDLQYFIYKQCYLYYNWTGGIKIPAPCQYAKKLAILVGDKLSSNKEIVFPEERFIKEIRSLYFL